MKRYFYLLLVLFSCLCFGRVVSAVDYDIESYQGDLALREDNTATYTEKVTYTFNDDYNGQIVSLGSAGKMPNGFAIDGNPTVSVLTNGEPDMDINPKSETWEMAMKSKSIIPETTVTELLLL